MCRSRLVQQPEQHEYMHCVQVKELKNKPGVPQEQSKKVLDNVDAAVSKMNEAAGEMARAYVDVDPSDVPSGSSTSRSTGIAELHQESG